MRETKNIAKKSKRKLHKKRGGDCCETSSVKPIDCEGNHRQSIVVPSLAGWSKTEKFAMSRNHDDGPNPQPLAFMFSDECPFRFRFSSTQQNNTLKTMLKPRWKPRVKLRRNHNYDATSVEPIRQNPFRTIAVQLVPASTVWFLGSQQKRSAFGKSSLFSLLPGPIPCPHNHRIRRHAKGGCLRR